MHGRRVLRVMVALVTAEYSLREDCLRVRLPPLSYVRTVCAVLHH